MGDGEVPVRKGGMLARSREGKDSEYYKGIIRQLKSEVRNLRKRLSKLENRSPQEDEQQDLMQEMLDAEVMCQHCGKGVIEEIDLGVRLIHQCGICGHRKISKKHG